MSRLERLIRELVRDEGGVAPGELERRIREIAREEAHKMFARHAGAPTGEMLMPTRLASSYVDPVKVLCDQAIEEMARIDRLCRKRGDDGYVYAVRHAGGGPTKIGRAADPLPRLADLQRMNPAPLVLVGLGHGASWERALHSQHMKQRVHGEWFLLDKNPLPVSDRCHLCRLEEEAFA